jgi:hypothetical protein
MGRRAMEKKIFKIQFVPRSKQYTFPLKTNQLMMYRIITTVSSEINEKHINALCGHNVELFSSEINETHINALCGHNVELLTSNLAAHKITDI